VAEGKRGLKTHRKVMGVGGEGGLGCWDYQGREPTKLNEDLPSCGKDYTYQGMGPATRKPRQNLREEPERHSHVAKESERRTLKKRRG